MSAFSDPEIGAQPEPIPVILRRASILTSEQASEANATQFVEPVALDVSRQKSAFSDPEIGPQPEPIPVPRNRRTSDFSSQLYGTEVTPPKKAVSEKLESFQNSVDKMFVDSSLGSQPALIHVPSKHKFSESLEVNVKQIVPLLSDDSFSYVASDKLQEESIEKSLNGPVDQKSILLSRDGLELGSGNSVVMSGQAEKNEILVDHLTQENLDRKINEGYQSDQNEQSSSSVSGAQSQKQTAKRSFILAKQDVTPQKSNSLSRASSQNLTPEQTMPPQMAMHMQLNDLFDEVLSEVNEDNQNVVPEMSQTSEAFYSIKNHSSIIPKSDENANQKRNTDILVRKIDTSKTKIDQDAIRNIETQSQNESALQNTIDWSKGFNQNSIEDEYNKTIDQTAQITQSANQHQSVPTELTHQHQPVPRKKFQYPIDLERNVRRLNQLTNSSQTTQIARNCINAIEALENDIHLQRSAQLLAKVESRRIETSIATRMSKLRTPKQNKYILQEMLVNQNKNECFTSQLFTPKCPLVKKRVFQVQQSNLQPMTPEPKFKKILTSIQTQPQPQSLAKSRSIPLFIKLQKDHEMKMQQQNFQIQQAFMQRRAKRQGYIQNEIINHLNKNNLKFSIPRRSNSPQQAGGICIQSPIFYAPRITKEDTKQVSIHLRQIKKILYSKMIDIQRRESPPRQRKEICLPPKLPTVFLQNYPIRVTGAKSPLRIIEVPVKKSEQPPLSETLKQAMYDMKLKEQNQINNEHRVSRAISLSKFKRPNTFEFDFTDDHFESDMMLIDAIKAKLHLIDSL